MSSKEEKKSKKRKERAADGGEQLESSAASGEEKAKKVKKKKKEDEGEVDSKKAKEIESASSSSPPAVETKQGSLFSDQVFADLPIGEKTKKALVSLGFAKMTQIQAKSIPDALAGKDILGAAKTGSGKTLAFLA